ncbi:MAG: hypothetical protein D6756_13710 [Cyanobacteria bacterium J083]|nr:MAG: hypothetical protein D6756_13710 [Cyanobacteria bacterium J083]
MSKQYFYGLPYFWRGGYIVASCGDVTVEHLKAYLQNQSSFKK